MSNESRVAETAVFNKTKMIGRQKLFDKIKTAINDDKTYIFYLEAWGGIGKTRLQEEIGNYVETLQTEKKIRIRQSKIIDFYHSDMHSNSRIEQALIEQLDPQHEFFGNYINIRKQLEKQQTYGMPSSIIGQKTLMEAFNKGFKALTKAHRVVIRIDTLELVQRGSDAVHKICEVEEENSIVKTWLLKQVSQFSNTVTIFTGRPNKDTKADFHQQFNVKNCIYTIGTIKQFLPSEAKAYLIELTEHNEELKRVLFPTWWKKSQKGNKPIDIQTLQINEEVFQQLYEGSNNGRPIYLNLLADLLALGVDIGEIFPPGEPVNVNKVEKTIAQRLIRELPEPYDYIIYLLIYTRQGLNVPLLLHLTDNIWSKKEAVHYLQEMRQYTFIKTHPQDPEELFLHDEVYDLLDRCHLSDRQKAEPIFEKIRDYYRKDLDDLRVDIVKVRQEKGSASREGHIRLIRQRDDLRTIFLHYQMQVDPLFGFFRYYLSWTEVTIRGREPGYDMRLRDIISSFLNYLKTTNTPRKQWLLARVDDPAFKRMFAISWILRYVERRQLKKAQRVAKNLQESKALAFNWNKIDDDLYKGLLLMIWGEAMTLANMDINSTLAKLREAKEILNRKQSNLLDMRNEEWRWARILGRTLSDIGFTYRSHNRFSSAIKPNRDAIALYRRVDIRDEMANTVTNLAYVYIQTGLVDEAEALLEDALKIREYYGQHYWIGLSYNLKGIWHQKMGHPHQALAWATGALAMFTVPRLENEQELGNAFACGLAEFERGRSYRGLGKMGHSSVYNRKQVEEHFSAGHDAFHRAADLFSDAGKIYTVQNKSNAGRLYRDWMEMDLFFGDDRAAQQHFDLTRLYLGEALAMARENNFKEDEADLLHDLAVLYQIQGHNEKALAYLEKAEKQIPNEYKPRHNQGFMNIPNPVDIFWMILGKIYMTKADLMFDPEPFIGPLSQEDDANMLAAFENRLLAVACFEKSSPFPDPANPLMRDTRKIVYESIKRYGAPRLRRIQEKINEVARNYKINLQSIQGYLERTIGVFIEAER